MNNMRIPSRRAPTVEDARRSQNNKNSEKKKLPPPRPPPPNFNLAKSKSAWSLSPNDNTISLIDWSPPNSPKLPNNYSHSQFNGSVSSSFSSSTSSLASSKKSYEFENANDWFQGLQVSNSTFYQKPPVNTNIGSTKIGPGPTIIRPAPPKKKALRPTASANTSREVSPLPPQFQTGILTPITQHKNLNINVNDARLNAEKDVDNSPPMPNIPPPSPPKVGNESVDVTPFGIALYDYNTGQQGDLQFSVNDVIYLSRKINDEWMMGRTVDDREGMFPCNFIDIQVPLPEDASVVSALYDFQTNMAGDLNFNTGAKIKVLKIIDSNWLEGECLGRRGQFPASFVDRIPNI